MFRVCSFRYGGAVGRKVATAAAAGRGKRGRGRPATQKATSTPTTPRRRVNASEVTNVKPEESDAVIYASARPAYMSEKREKEVLAMAERMQGRDLTGEVPVASFAYEIIQKHPSVRTMGLRERMDFLCTRWAKLSEKKRIEYLNDPLKGLI